MGVLPGLRQPAHQRNHQQEVQHGVLETMKSYITKQPAFHHKHGVGDFVFDHEVVDSLPLEERGLWQKFVQSLKLQDQHWIDGRSAISTTHYIQFMGRNHE